MNLSNPKLAEIVDYEADFTALMDIYVSDCQQELKRNVLCELRKGIEVDISKMKTIKDIDMLMKEHNSVAYKKEEVQKKIAERMKVKKIDDKKKTLLEKMLNLYRKNLGFHMGTTDDISEESNITFIFKNINKKNAQETFSLSLVTDGIIYKVTSCQPMIDSLDELVTDLCETNELGEFIIQIRRKFCSISNVK